MLKGIDACLHGQEGMEEDLRRVEYLPDPAAIKAGCAEIRAGWSIAEERRRFVGMHPDDETPMEWMPPFIDLLPFNTGKQVESGTMGGNH